MNTKETQAKYGITKQEYDALKIAHDKQCYICGDTDRIGLDHNHKTGKIRKFLCRRCNMLVGLYELYPELYENIKWYVYEHRN